MNEKDNITLSFDEQPQAPAAPELGVKQAEIVDRFSERELTEEEKKMVEDFSNKIQITNSQMIFNYGAGAQKKIADFSEMALEGIKTKDLGEIGDMLGTVVTELKSFEEEEPKGIMGFFKKGTSKIEAMKSKYSKVETNVNGIVKILEDHQITLLKDISRLDQMYEMNTTYFKELSMYILAGKKKLNKVKSEDLPGLIAKAESSGLPEDSQAVNDMNNMINRFEKKIHDLDLTRMISIQMAPQIRLVQNNNMMMAEKIQSTIVNTIPLWKSQMVLALGVTHSQQAIKAQQQVNALTNEMLKKNAETLKMATIETARESEKGIVDIETLRSTNQSLISTLDEVVQIQSEGRAKRAEAEAELLKIETELKQRLLALSNK